MAQTNVQAFSGDVAISSNLAVDTNTLFVDSVGNKVGIGTTNPSLHTHIKTNNTGSTDDGLLIENTYSSNAQKTVLRLGIGSANYAQIDTRTKAGDKAYLTFSTQSGTGSWGDRMTIDEVGNVGIGTASPTGQLEVHGVGQTSQTSFNQAGLMGGVLALRSDDGGTGSGGAVMFGTNAGFHAAIKASLEDGSSNTRGRLAFFTRNIAGDATMSHAMTIADGGNVGIGKTNPGTALDVVGTVTATSYSGSGANLTGISAGYNAAVDTIKIGNGAGTTGQGSNSVAIGHDAGQYNQGIESVAVGYQAGSTGQGSQAVAVGPYAGLNSQQRYAVAVGFNAGNVGQGMFATALGGQSGRYNQGTHTVAVGVVAGMTSQGTLATAVGYYAGHTGQGTNATAVGRNAGENNQSADSIVISAGNTTVNGNLGSGRFFVGLMRANNSGSIMRWNTTTKEVCRDTSDDRLKDDEKLIRNALNTIMKLKPQIYEKRGDLDPQSQTNRIESGHMAQDVYYDTPELRHLVQVPDTALPTPEKPPAPSDDIRDDPDYSAWGVVPTDFDKEGLIPYLVRGIQELNRELPRSKTTVSNTWGQNISSLVVSANTNKHKTNTVPVVTLSAVQNDKSWYGVVSDEVADTDDYDTLIDTKGDTRIWVVDTNGSLESGDLLTTSNISPGYAQKQGDDFLRSYTVAKMTQDCDFTEPIQRPILRRKQQLSDVTYYLKIQEAPIVYSEYMGIVDERRCSTGMAIVYRKAGETDSTFIYHDTVNTIEVDENTYNELPDSQRSVERVREITEEEYNEFSDEEKIGFTRVEKIIYNRKLIFESKLQKTSHPVEDIRQELVDVLDENGQITWEETGETEPIYTLIDHETHKAALVTCKLI